MKRHLLKIIPLVIILIVQAQAKAQTRDSIPLHKSPNQKLVDSLTYEMDVVDFINKSFHVHLTSKPDTLKLKPGKLFFAFVPAVGYTLEGSWLGNISLNTSFYLSNPDSTNLSTITYGALYTVRHQFVMPIITEVWSKNNKLNWLGDWRFYKYPANTYGLGAKTNAANADLVDFLYVRFYQECLLHFHAFYYFGGGVNYDDHFNIKEGGTNADYTLYNKGATHTVSSGPVLHFMYDSRTNTNNPRDASYISLTYRNNNSIFGSSSNWQEIFAEYKTYICLSHHSSNTLCLWSWNVFTFGGNAPYFDLPSNGWDIYSNSGRGYIQGRFRGQNMVYAEAEYRFKITRRGLLGGVIFTNAESLSEYPSNKFQAIDPGYGGGLRLKMNKYSDVNLGIDYAFGLNGSKGVFFNLGEVF